MFKIYEDIIMLFGLGLGFACSILIFIICSCCVYNGGSTHVIMNAFNEMIPEFFMFSVIMIICGFSFIHYAKQVGKKEE
jgi:hypothetical protein